MKANTFEKIIQAAKCAGADAIQTVGSMGTLYHDGAQHGKLFDVVRITVDKYQHGQAAAQIARNAAKAAARFKGVTVKEDMHPHFYIYNVMLTEDIQKAESMRQEAQTFLNAFHQERHRQHMAGEEYNTNKAIAAGHMALINAGHNTMIA